MNFSVSAIVILAALCGVLSVRGNPTSSYIQSVTDQHLIKYMSEAFATNSRGPVEQAACFDHYVPLMAANNENYEKEFKACSVKANLAVEELFDQGSQTRKEFMATGKAVCQRFDDCNALNEILPFFDCYSNLGDKSIHDVYTVSQSASDEAANYQEQFRAIKFNEEKCQNETQRMNAINTAKLIEGLNDCLMNGLNIPTTQAPSTLPPSSEATSTLATELTSETISSDVSPSISASRPVVVKSNPKQRRATIVEEFEKKMLHRS